MFPLEAAFDRPGPEVPFGEGLAIAALRARQRAEAVATTPRSSPYRSAVAIALWRREPDAVQPDRTIRARDLDVTLPLMAPPTAEEIGALRAELEDEVARLQAAGAERDRWNPAWLQAHWARAVERRVADGTVETDVPVRAHVLTIGDITLVGLPVEPFCEIGLRVKERAGPRTLVLGYTNGMAGYLPVSEEYPFGGYEPTTGQRNFGTAAPFAPDAADVLVEHVCDALAVARPEYA
jgi:hypothetical protein